MEKENKLPKITHEQIALYKKKSEACDKAFLKGDKVQDIMEELTHLLNEYDWMSYIFEGENGKKGMKNAPGDIIIPANYDDFLCTFNYEYPLPAMPTLKNGKWGLVTTDGSGTEMTDFIYDEFRDIEWVPGYFLFKKDGSQKYGLITYDGNEVLPCTLDPQTETLSHVVFIYSGEKCGLVVTCYDTVIEPIYDKIEVEGDSEAPITFTKNGVEGYVNLDGEFISKKDLEKLEQTDVEAFEKWDGELICAQYDFDL